MKPLRVPPPPDRTPEQLWNHYQVESALARRLKAAATPEARSVVLATMYDELFAAVPDHPRLTLREKAPERALRAKRSSVSRWLKPDDTVIEFAPGDCEFAAAIAGRVRQVIGIDVSDQRKPGRSWPSNLQHVVYNGRDLPQLPRGFADVVLSDQLLEHLHPDDAAHHLKLCFDLLKPGGRYVINTPHADSGPWDVSRYFSETPEGFHLREWRYADLLPVLRETGFSRIEVAWVAKGICVPMPRAWFLGIERVANRIPKRIHHRAMRLLIPATYCVATKPAA